ncbi:MAG: rhodanese-like domain-containing protein [Flavipsychrobacter sp.]|nr:rhodanese-like domain-containing protein [Flavipsychrobacter sp.]
MNKVITLLLLVLMGNMASCQSAGKKLPDGTTSVSVTVSAEDFQKKMSSLKDVQLVDVRTPEEYREGHIKNSLNINVQGSSFEAEVAKLDKKRPVMVYCRSGGRSASAQRMLIDMGFAEVINLDGGIRGWQSSGKPVE